MVERSALDREVVGSNPTSPAKKKGNTMQSNAWVYAVTLITILWVGAYACKGSDQAPVEEAPPIVISEEDEIFTTFSLLLEHLELCKEVCGADDNIGARLNPETLERSCICPDGTTPLLP